MWLAVVTLAAVALPVGAVLMLADRKLPRRSDRLVERIEALLPRIQCAQCGFPGCTRYATAIAAGSADINLCPPGGQDTVNRLAQLLGRDAQPVTGAGTASLENVAVINEAVCIGCNLCAEACPVDAIVGSPHYLHYVLASNCTGCELCLPPCPVNCIDLVSRS